MTLKVALVGNIGSQTAQCIDVNNSGPNIVLCHTPNANLQV